MKIHETSKSVLRRLRIAEEEIRRLKTIVDYLVKSKDYIPQAEGEKARSAALMLENTIDELRYILDDYKNKNT